MIRRSLVDFELLWENNEIFLPHRSPFHVNTARFQIISEKRQIDEVAGNILSDRSEAAHHAPISLGKVLCDIGFLGATPAVEKILEGTFFFPLDMDKHTRLLSEEAARTFGKNRRRCNGNFCHH